MWLVGVEKGWNYDCEEGEGAFYVEVIGMGREEEGFTLSYRCADAVYFQAAVALHTHETHKGVVGVCEMTLAADHLLVYIWLVYPSDAAGGLTR